MTGRLSLPDVTRLFTALNTVVALAPESFRSVAEAGRARVVAALEAAGWLRSELASAAGVPKETIAAWLRLANDDDTDPASVPLRIVVELEDEPNPLIVPGARSSLEDDNVDLEA